MGLWSQRTLPNMGGSVPDWYSFRYGFSLLDKGAVAHLPRHVSFWPAIRGTRQFDLEESIDSLRKMRTLVLSLTPRLVRLFGCARHLTGSRSPCGSR
jgi:hypothetical protein